MKKRLKFPANPQYIYRDEWEGFTGFLGTSKGDPRYRDFDQARAFAFRLARKYGIDTNKKWKAWHRGQILGAPAVPPDIPLDARAA